MGYPADAWVRILERLENRNNVFRPSPDRPDRAAKTIREDTVAWERDKSDIVYGLTGACTTACDFHRVKYVAPNDNRPGRTQRHYTPGAAHGHYLSTYARPVRTGSRAWIRPRRTVRRTEIEKDTNSRRVLRARLMVFSCTTPRGATVRTSAISRNARGVVETFRLHATSRAMYQIDSIVRGTRERKKYNPKLRVGTSIYCILSGRLIASSRSRIVLLFCRAKRTSDPDHVLSFLTPRARGRYLRWSIREQTQFELYWKADDYRCW